MPKQPVAGSVHQDLVRAVARQSAVRREVLKVYLRLIYGCEDDERPLRLLQDVRAQEPVCQILEATGYHAAGSRTVAYFKSIAEEMGIPYQSLINLYLRDCAMHHSKLRMKWVS